MVFIWRNERRFNSYKNFLKNQFGGRVQKLTIDAGFICPNRDGTVGTGGCTYCLNDAFNPSYCHPQKSVKQQLEEGITFHLNRYRRANGYLAYFQAYSNTYAPLEQLKQIYMQAIEHPLIKGIVIGTRPDCMDEEKLAFFQELNKKLFVSIEYGVESTSEETLLYINRGHTFELAESMIRKTSDAGLCTGAHFIFGLPNENINFWFDQIHRINSLPLHSIKFHQLQIIKGTRMEQEHQEKKFFFQQFDIEKYVRFICDYIEKLNPNFIIERFAGEVPPRYLSLNTWGITRYDVVLNKIETELERRDSWQGKYFTT
ncbi:MAG: TIGR01212 family radical SAM protein [Bacteroidales bacterium]|jgi:radical SAM protein (TIGR01212 family)|nr:TIGR01212 family radical SAM protein [Bacteroidales bacterium]